MKRINVKVVPGAKIEQVQKSFDENIKVWVRGKPILGEANRAVIDLLSRYYKVPKNYIKIVSGQKSRNKIIEIQ